MKVLLTLGYRGERDAFENALREEVATFVDSGGAARAAVDVRAGGRDHDELAQIDTESDASALVSLWEVRSVETTLELGTAAGGHLVGAYRVDEVVQRDYERAWAEGEVSPGVKLVCLVRRRPDLSHEAYSDHWRQNHGPLALKHQPGFWHYVQNHVTERLTGDTPDFDGIGELHFRSAAEVETGMFDSEEGQRLIWEDTLRFMDHDTSTTLLTKEHLIRR